MKTLPHEHVYMVNKVQKEHSQLHDKVCVVDICSFILPGPRMLQIPEVNGVSENKDHIVFRFFLNIYTRVENKTGTK